MRIEANIWDLLVSEQPIGIRRKSGLGIAYTPPTDGNWFILTLSTKRDIDPPSDFQIAGVRNATLKVCKQHGLWKISGSRVDPPITTKKHHIRRVRFFVVDDV